MIVYKYTQCFNTLTEDFNIEFNKIWIYAEHGAERRKRYSCKNNRRS